MLAVHPQPTLPGAAGRSEREPGVQCQDLETNRNTNRNEKALKTVCGEMGWSL